MSAEIKVVKKDSRETQKTVPELAAYATLAATDGKRGAENDPRALWLVILQALAMVAAAIRKHIGKRDSCETCGRVL